MATNFPTSVDNFTNPTANDSLNSPSHSVQHANANDAIEAIETYLLSGGQGLNFIGTYSATNSSLTVDNVFNSTYDNYKVLITGTASAITPMRFNMRTTAPATDSTAAYDYTAIRVNAGTGTVNSAYASSNTNLFITDLFTARHFTATLELQSPFLALNTFINGFSNYVANSDFYTSNNSIRTTTQYAGFTVYQQSGNFTTITAKVYGYRNV